MDKDINCKLTDHSEGASALLTLPMQKLGTADSKRLGYSFQMTGSDSGCHEIQFGKQTKKKLSSDKFSIVFVL